MNPGERGFSLLELLVATAVMAVAMLFATRLLLVAQVELARAQIELRDPLPRYAETRLRRELEAAARVPALRPAWSGGRLLVLGATGERVAWGEREGTLERLELGPGGAVERRHAVLQGVLDWRWRKVAPRLVDFEVRYATREALSAAVPGAPATWTPRSRTATVWRRVFLHGAGGAP